MLILCTKLNSNTVLNRLFFFFFLIGKGKKIIKHEREPPGSQKYTGNVTPVIIKVNDTVPDYCSYRHLV